MFQAEARLAAKRAARAEAREIRMKELERQQKEVMRASSSVLSGRFHFRPSVRMRGPCPCDVLAIRMHVPGTSVPGQAGEGA